MALPSARAYTLFTAQSGLHHRQMNMKSHIECAVREIRERTFGVTRQYLEMNSVAMKDGEYEIERIQESTEELTVYFKILDENYFLGVTVEKTDCKVRWVFVENGNSCRLTATSEALDLQELSRYLPIQFSKGWSRGDLRKNGSRHTFSRISYEMSTSSCRSTTDSINLLLDHFSEHKDSIVELSRNARAYISVCKHQYVSENAGMYFDVQLIRRLAEFNLAVDLDIYICGNPIT